MCTAHSIEARDLFNAVLADINRFADMAVNDEKAVRAIERRLTETDQSRAKSLEKEKKKLNKRLAELLHIYDYLLYILAQFDLLLFLEPGIPIHTC